MYRDRVCTSEGIQNSRLNVDKIPDCFQEFLVMNYYIVVIGLCASGNLLCHVLMVETEAKNLEGSESNVSVLSRDILTEHLDDSRSLKLHLLNHLTDKVRLLEASTG